MGQKTSELLPHKRSKWGALFHGLWKGCTICTPISRATKKWKFMIFAPQKNLVKLLEEMETSWAVIKAYEASWVVNRVRFIRQFHWGPSCPRTRFSQNVLWIERQLQRMTELESLNSRTYPRESFLRTYWPFIIVKSPGTVSQQEADWCALFRANPWIEHCRQMQWKALLLGAWGAVHYSSSTQVSVT